jgi:LPXTG-motif cell wall-anchored protein
MIRGFFVKRIFLILPLVFILLSPLKVYGENNSNDLDLTTNPGKVLFDLTNVKPGDSVIRDLTITNNGNKDFKYLTSNNFISGSDLFYRKLDLKIKDNNTVLYDGKLSKFAKLEPRLLESKHNEKLIFNIQIPTDLGNEYQGLDTEFQLKFYVEGTLGGILPANGPKLPVTGTNTYNYFVAGAIIVLGGLLLQFLIKRKNLIV